MSAQDPLVRRDDLARAREIARSHLPFVGVDMLLERVAEAIAQGIAEGRERAVSVSNREPIAVWVVLYIGLLVLVGAVKTYLR